MFRYKWRVNRRTLQHTDITTRTIMNLPILKNNSRLPPWHNIALYICPRSLLTGHLIIIIILSLSQFFLNNFSMVSWNNSGSIGLRRTKEKCICRTGLAPKLGWVLIRDVLEVVNKDRTGAACIRGAYLSSHYAQLTLWLPLWRGWWVWHGVSGNGCGILLTA